MKPKHLILPILLCFAVLSLTNLPFATAQEKENVLWSATPKEGSYTKFFGKRVVDVMRGEAGLLIPQEFGWQGNQLIFIFRLTSEQLEAPQYEFTFEVTSKDYDSDEPVEIDIYAGTNINNLKTVKQGIVINRLGIYTIVLPSAYFYLGSQNFIKISGRNVLPIGYGENPPNCRFGTFKLAIPAGEEEIQQTEAEEKQEEEVLDAEAEPLGPSIS